jgi:oligoendopeptidase F
VTLSQRVLSGQPGSVEAYLKFLRSGGSKFPLATLKAAGVDMTTPAPIESTLQLFEHRLNELEELLL